MTVPRPWSCSQVKFQHTICINHYCDSAYHSLLHNGLLITLSGVTNCDPHVKFR